jgi:hypothetical protein
MNLLTFNEERRGLHPGESVLQIVVEVVQIEEEVSDRNNDVLAL